MPLQLIQRFAEVSPYCATPTLLRAAVLTDLDDGFPLCSSQMLTN